MTVHQIWFGDKIQQIEKLMQSVKTHNPNYKRWDESNIAEFNINLEDFENYAFASDYLRLLILQKYGGFYVDSDVLCKKPITKLQNYDEIISSNLAFMYDTRRFRVKYNNGIMYMKKGYDIKNIIPSKNAPAVSKEFDKKYQKENITKILCENIDSDFVMVHLNYGSWYKKHITVHLITTFDCNLDCGFCIVDTHTRKKRNIENVVNRAKQIPAFSTVYLCGGEIGTVKEEYIRELIDILYDKCCKLILQTNGLFIKKYEKYLKYFDKIEYNSSESMDKENFVFSKELYSTYDIEKLLIVSDDNIDKLKNYLKKHKVDRIIPAIHARKTLLSLKNLERLEEIVKKTHTINKSKDGLSAKLI
jgi:organic radical activating enzyme